MGKQQADSGGVQEFGSGGRAQDRVEHNGTACGRVGLVQSVQKVSHDACDASGRDHTYFYGAGWKILQQCLKCFENDLGGEGLDAAHPMVFCTVSAVMQATP